MKHGLYPVLALMFLLHTSCTSLGQNSTHRDIAAEYYAIGEGYAAITKYDKAIVYFQKAAKQKEYSNAANYSLGRMYALSGKWKEAADVFSSLYKQDKTNILVSTAYSFALVSNGEKEKALDISTLLWQNCPDDPVVGRNYAGMLILAGKYTESLDHIVLLKARFPDSDALKGIEDLEKKAKEALAPKIDTVPDSASKETVQEKVL